MTGKVFVVIDDCPSDFGEKEIINVYMRRLDAQKFIKSKKKKDDYLHQYLVIKAFELK